MARRERAPSKSGTKTYRTLASLFRRLGPIAPARVRLCPAPGTAEEHHVLEIEAKEDRLCELVDGVLIEKDMTTFESLIGGLIGHFLLVYLETRDLGVVLGAGGMLRLAPGLIRIPDVSFITWNQMPGGKFPEDPIASLYPDLAVEVISPGNSAGEMRRKLRDYFAAGTQLMWFVYPKTRIAEVYTNSGKRTALTSADSLQGGDVLPGFELSLEKLFARVRRQDSR